jgi:hypothetical protein
MLVSRVQNPLKSAEVPSFLNKFLLHRGKPCLLAFHHDLPGNRKKNMLAAIKTTNVTQSNVVTEGTLKHPMKSADNAVGIYSRLKDCHLTSFILCSDGQI